MAPPKRKRTLRGVQNIRTLSGRADEKLRPHKVFLRIACLEMERERRGHERRCAAERVEVIEERFREIDAEKRELMAELAAEKPQNRPGGPAGEPAPDDPPRDGSGFRFKY